MDFHIKKGRIRTKQKYKRPTRIKFEEWTKKVKKYIRDHDIHVNMYLCGNFLTDDTPTWDVDVILSHPKPHEGCDLLKIRDLMEYSMQMGFDDYQMCIDMQFYYPYNDKGEFWYSADDYLKHGCTITTKICPFNYIDSNGVILHLNGSNFMEIIPNLFTYDQKSPSDKDIKRIEDGIMYANPVQI